jgi:hypothetical protein
VQRSAVAVPPAVEPRILAERALDWLAAQLPAFEPFQGKERPPELRQKALAELGLLCLWLQPTPFARDPRLQAYARFVDREQRSPRFAHRLFRVPNVFVRYAALAIALEACGLPRDEERRAALQRFLDEGNAIHTERTGHGLLELRYLLDQGRFRHHLPSYAALARRSILHTPFDLVTLTEMDVYAITHAVFFLTNFGQVGLRGFTAAHTREVDRAIDVLLGMHLHKRNWDLAAELVMCHSMLGGANRPIHRYALRALAEAQQPDGAVAGPVYDSAHADELSGAEKADYVFEQCYHTTLVAALAGAYWRD